MSTILDGAVAGCIATAPMTLTMGMLYQYLPTQDQYPLPPSQITDRVVEEGVLQQHLDAPAHTGLTTVNHFAYGAAAGALYAPLAERLPLSPVASGVAFGLFVWTASYQGWLPALGVLPPASESPTSRNALMIAAHIVWGAATGLLLERLQSRR